MRSRVVGGVVGLAGAFASGVGGWGGGAAARAAAGPGLAVGSPYVSVDLGTNDGNYVVVPESGRLLGAGTVDSFSFYARTTDPVRPLILRQASADTFDVVGVGNPFTPAAAGQQTAVPYQPVLGTAAYDATGGGGNYYFGVAPVGSAPLPVAYNLNPVAGGEGSVVHYRVGSVVGTGPIAVGHLSGPAETRHYELTVDTRQAGVQETVGLGLANRAYVDGAGLTVVRTDAGFAQAGRVSSWSGYADVDAAATIAPLILRNVGSAGSPNYSIVGVGTARTFAARDFFDVAFGLVSGTDVVRPGDLIGWSDVGTAASPGGAGGVVPYNLNYLAPLSSPSATVSYFATGGAALTAGAALGTGSADARSYSIAFQTVAVPEPAAAATAAAAAAGLLAAGRPGRRRRPSAR